MFCSSLAKDNCTPNIAKVCRFLISEHAGLVRRRDCDGRSLPIRLLAKRCNRPLVQEIAVLLLKAYPECVHVRAAKWQPRLSTVPFIQQVLPLVHNELEIDQEILLISQRSENLTKVTFSPTNGPTSTRAQNDFTLKASLIGAIAEVFRSWANLL